MIELPITINGEPWTLRLSRRRDMRRRKRSNEWGLCEWDKNRITVRRDLSELNFLDTVIHELLHAELGPLADECWVERVGTEMALAITKAMEARSNCG